MIELTHLQKVSGQTPLLSLDKLSVAAGEVTAVTGLAGQAKEAFIGLLSGQIRPTAGTVRVAALDPAVDHALWVQRVGLMPAADGFYPRLPVRQNLALYADLYGLAAERVEAVLAEVGLADQTQQRVGDLPVGLARRLAFGRAILHQPAVLLLIDPFAECDTASIALLHRLIQAQAAADTAVLLVSGETVGLTRLCQTIYVFDGGRLSHQYRPDEPAKENSLPFKIPARLEGKVALINPGDILYATTDEGQTVLCTADGPIPTHFTLTELETRLAHNGFFRAHRSYLVNLQQVKEVIAYTRDSFSLILENSREEIPLSKGAAKELREVLGY